MSMSTSRLELTWVGKEQRPRLEPRILLENPEKAYHAAQRVDDDDIFDNRLIFGDNLLALKALEQEFAGQVKCVFIDPPYNTGSAFKHYDDGLEHSIWVSLMRDRLEIIRRLLRQDGSLWITIDDNEAHYLKVLCDEIFGRINFVATVVWQKLHARNNSAQHLSTDHDFILVYASSLDKWRRNKLGRTEASDADFWNPDSDPRGLWRRSDLTAAKPYADGHYEVTGPHGDRFSPRGNRCWSISRETFRELESDSRIWWGKTGRTFPFRKRFQTELGELVPTSVWVQSEVGNNREAKQEVTRIFGRDQIFSTPKPERLLNRVIHIASDPGDLILDSFAGSGTTGAVAHKMGRRWIMVEFGEHCHTHIIPADEEGDRRGGPGRNHEGGRVEGRRWLPLLPARTLAAGEGPLGELGHQHRVQRCDAGGGGVQAGGLRLRAVGDVVLAARPLHGDGLHLRHDPDPDLRAASEPERRGRRAPLAAGVLLGVSGQAGCLREPYPEEDPEGGDGALRVGP